MKSFSEPFLEQEHRGGNTKRYVNIQICFTESLYPY